MRFSVGILGRAVAACAGLANVLPIADDRAFLASFPALLADFLDDEAVIAKFVSSVSVLEKREAQILSLLALVDFRFLDLGNVDV